MAQLLSPGPCRRLLCSISSHACVCMRTCPGVHLLCVYECVLVCVFLCVCVISLHASLPALAPATTRGLRGPGLLLLSRPSDADTKA